MKLQQSLKLLHVFVIFLVLWRYRRSCSNISSLKKLYEVKGKRWTHWKEAKWCPKIKIIVWSLQEFTFEKLLSILSRAKEGLCRLEACEHVPSRVRCSFLYSAVFGRRLEPDCVQVYEPANIIIALPNSLGPDVVGDHWQGDLWHEVSHKWNNLRLNQTGFWHTFVRMFYVRMYFSNSWQVHFRLGWRDDLVMA